MRGLGLVRVARRLARRGRLRASGTILVAAWLMCSALHVAADEASLAAAEAPSWWLRSRTTGYLFEVEHPSGASIDRFGAYQDFDGAVSGLSGGRFALRASGRFADDLFLREKVTTRSRLYSGHFETRFSRRAVLRAGRQFIQEGPAGLTLDGLLLTLRPRSQWDLRAWGGGRAPFSREFSIGDWSDDAAWGARAGFVPSRAFRAVASWSYRERGGRVASRPFGMEVAVAAPMRVWMRGRAAYDTAHEAWERADVFAQWSASRAAPVIAFEFVDRRPAVDAASYFSRFAVAERTRLARGSVRYEHARGFGAEAEYLGSFVEDRTSTRLGGALLAPLGRVGYSARIGDAGEESRWFGELVYRATRWLSLEAGATLATYALFEDALDADERDVTTAFGRLRAFPRHGVGVTLEVQSLDNPEVSEDIRVLAAVDLTAARGPGLIGLDKRGWLP
ncbi:MAG: hypothetical protein ACKVU1_04595 [bacterium]